MFFLLYKLKNKEVRTKQTKTDRRTNNNHKDMQRACIIIVEAGREREEEERSGEGQYRNRWDQSTGGRSRLKTGPNGTTAPKHPIPSIDPRPGPRCR